MNKTKNQLEKKTVLSGIGNSLKNGGNIIKQKVY